MRSLIARTACRDAAGRFIGQDAGFGGELSQRIQLQECLEHCLAAHTIVGDEDERQRKDRPGLITSEEMRWFRKVLEGKPEWASSILAKHGFR